MPRPTFAAAWCARAYIKGIIGLPPNLFYGTGIPACIVVVDKLDAQARKGIFMIDASAGFMKDGPKNRLRAQDIHRIVDVFNKAQDIPRYARLVSFDEIEKNEFNLNLPRVAGENFTAAIDISGRALPELDGDEWTVAGVDPGGLADCRSTPQEAYEQFRLTLKSVLFDCADANSQDFAAFCSAVRSFGVTRNDTATKRWEGARREIKKGSGLQEPFAASLPKRTKNILSSLQIVRLDEPSHDLRVQMNVMTTNRISRPPRRAREGASGWVCLSDIFQRLSERPPGLTNETRISEGGCDGLSSPFGRWNMA